MNQSWIFDRLELPTLIPWPVELEAALKERGIGDQEASYGSYIAGLRSIDAESINNDQRLELAISHCVEGEMRPALEVLLRVSIDEFQPLRRCIYYRLLGAVYRDLGATQSASAAYQQALELARSEESKQYVYLERSIRWDLFTLADRIRDDEEYKAIFAIDTWNTLIPAEFSQNDMFGQFNREGFEMVFLNEHSTRSSNGIPMAYMQFNRTLSIAYLMGDFSVARLTRRKFVRELVRISDAHSGEEFRVAVRELICARETDDLKRILERYGYLIASSFDLKAELEGLNPIEEDGSAAAEVNLTALILLKNMGQYLTDETRTVWAERLLESAVRFLGGQSVPIVQNDRYREKYFVDAMAEVGGLSSLQLERFVDALGGQGVNQVFSFWQVLSKHRWVPDDAIAARKAVKNLTAALSESSLSKDYAHEAVSTLIRIRRAIPSLVDAIDSVLVASIEQGAMLGDSFWYSILGSSGSLVSSRISEWVDQLVDETVQEFESAAEGDSIILNRTFHEILRLPAAYQGYPQHFPPDRQLRDVKRLLTASKNPSIYAREKSSAFEAIANIAKKLPEVERRSLRAIVKRRRAEDEESRPRHLLGDRRSMDAIESQLNLARLRVAVGLRQTASEAALMHQALTQRPDESTTLAAIELAGASLDGPFKDLALAGLSVALTDSRLVIEAEAAKVLTELAALWWEHPIRRTCETSLLARMSKGHPYVIQSIFAGAFEHIQELPREFRLAVEARAIRQSSNAHLSVRGWAMKIVARIAG
jgi:tetratricopeptide (TPR) repeat protein